MYLRSLSSCNYSKSRFLNPLLVNSGLTKGIDDIFLEFLKYQMLQYVDDASPGLDWGPESHAIIAENEKLAAVSTSPDRAISSIYIYRARDAR